MMRGPFAVQDLGPTRPEYPEWHHYAVRSGENYCLAIVGGVDRATADDSAGLARLFAASPDLLAVAKGALGYLKALPDYYRPDAGWIAPLEAAIRKAEAPHPMAGWREDASIRGDDPRGYPQMEWNKP